MTQSLRLDIAPKSILQIFDPEWTSFSWGFRAKIVQTKNQEKWGVKRVFGRRNKFRCVTGPQCNILVFDSKELYRLLTTEENCKLGGIQRQKPHGFQTDGSMCITYAFFIVSLVNSNELSPCLSESLNDVWSYIFFRLWRLNFKGICK